ncbi:leucyl aminopeptidase [Klugiella xanthotipulae]|uniref:Probable cytosol aminopeptidase n=1 Tax=Klugiella xanthotipulae TaxID=244735 RepID=A0A543HXQ7_9MICO|nr:leucyl aminopeptidase [Klugiella xanthotipulae]TQM63126.1 leucyl aminopeptidase [Klugiella xanthotipulae]
MNSAYKLIPAGFTPAPSLDAEAVTLAVLPAPSAEAGAIGYVVASDGEVPADLGLDRAALAAAGFEGKLGQAQQLLGAGPVRYAVGIGSIADRSAATLRDAAATFAQAAHRFGHLAFVGVDDFQIDPAAAGQALAEGVILARYRYTELKSAPQDRALAVCEVVSSSADGASLAGGIARGRVIAVATTLARDLANTPPSHLTAANFGDLAEQIAPSFGITVETFDKARLIELGTGGLLGVNAGSVEEPRLIKIRYLPVDNAGEPIPPRGELAFVGKGIMYDSGGISLKPSDPMHLSMKMDMAGAAAVFGAMTALRDVGCRAAVTAYLMCTDNMPSGSATKLGDVLTIRGGTTVEVKNTDAEGRLVLSDGLVLAAEAEPDAIIDIATLTGAALVALGTSTAAVFGNNQDLVNRVLDSSAATDEPLWQLPLEKKYREQLNSEIADLSNMGGKYAGSTLAALFLAEFVGETPWVHLDIAGTMQSETNDGWRPRGATGFGTRLLIDVAESFTR